MARARIAPIIIAGFQSSFSQRSAMLFALRSFRFLLILFPCLVFDSGAADEPVYDLVVYGGTSGGVAAAIQARRMKKSAIIVEPGTHLGGLTTGGLGATD